jgi:hypothetical protein
MSAMNRRQAGRLTALSPRRSRGVALPDSCGFGVDSRAERCDAMQILWVRGERGVGWSGTPETTWNMCGRGMKVRSYL